MHPSHLALMIIAKSYNWLGWSYLLVQQLRATRTPSSPFCCCFCWLKNLRLLSFSKCCVQIARICDSDQCQQPCSSVSVSLRSHLCMGGGWVGLGWIGVVQVLRCMVGSLEIISSRSLQKCSQCSPVRFQLICEFCLSQGHEKAGLSVQEEDFSSIQAREFGTPERGQARHEL